MKNLLWRMFEETGDIKIYLKYAKYGKKGALIEQFDKDKGDSDKIRQCGRL